MNPSNKKYKIVLKPLSGIWSRNDPDWAELHRRTGPQNPAVSQNRVIYADLIKVIDDGSMLVGIDPGNSTTSRQAIHASSGHAQRLKKRLDNPEFWTIGHTKPGINPNDPSHTDYTITKHFNKILSINLDNIISINDKPMMGRIDNFSLDAGISRLDIDESVVYEAVGKKHRIVMHRGTVIDADHIAPMVGNSDILMVGIGQGPGPTRQSHCRHPQPYNPDFWVVGQTKPYKPSTCKFWMRTGEVPTWIDEEGNTRPNGHTDWLTTLKFQKVITMHMKNIKSIDGKPVMHVSDGDLETGISRLDIDESWSIDNVSDMLED